MNYTLLAEASAKLIHNPGIQARAVLNAVYVDVDPEDDRTVKISFGPGQRPGETGVDFTLLDARKAPLDTLAGNVRNGDGITGYAKKALFEVIDVWYKPVA
ncbi:hypothetical protein DR950_17725 [Kitasatospora xanthocidica]|uniref:Uncharacterized protein n=1 Tax=Kitasatospora xanthocidica TaxID=83382 RepID=A0A372ZU22_9ACTN|nr:hypothetical protein [Kitasatospora xanthocidica]RGD59383.1 hypothetical protein DR950_17725 [Kitasatospora xanthocidica]